MDIIATHHDKSAAAIAQFPYGIMYVCTTGVIGDGAVYMGPAGLAGGEYAIARSGDKVDEETARKLFHFELQNRTYRR